jgi:hypothetical protein
MGKDQKCLNFYQLNFIYHQEKAGSAAEKLLNANGHQNTLTEGNQTNLCL